MGIKNLRRPKHLAAVGLHVHFFFNFLESYVSSQLEKGREGKLFKRDFSFGIINQLLYFCHDLRYFFLILSHEKFVKSSKRIQKI